MHELVGGVVPAQKTPGSLLKEAGSSLAPEAGDSCAPPAHLLSTLYVRHWARCCGSLMLIANKVPALRQLPV